MHLQKIFASIVLCCLFFANVFAQQKILPPPKPNEISPILKNEAVALLRETIKDIPNLKVPENRQYFSIEAASLLWDYDEKAALAMFQAEMNNVRQSLAQAAAEVSKAESKKDESVSSYGSNTAYSSYFSLNPKVRAQIQKVLTTRSFLISSLAEVNPQAANDFLQETAQTFSGSKSVSGAYGALSDEYLERQIAIKWVKRDADKAAEMTRRMLAKEFSPQTLNILEEIYEQNPEKGSQLAEEILQKLKTSNVSTEQESRKNAFAFQFLKTAAENLEQTKSQTGKKALLAESSLRELANYVGQAALINDLYLGYPYTKSEIPPVIEKYAPEKAAQIRKKRNQTVVMSTNSNISSNHSKSNSYSNTAVVVNVATNSVNPSPEELKRYRDETQKAEEKQKRIKAERDAVLEKIKQKNLSAEDKAFVISQVRKFALESREPYDQIKGIVFWAVLGAEAGNAEIAESLMREAESLTAPQTKNYQDYMSKWWLARGYSSIAPTKSFSLLETTVPPFNNIISSFVNIAEFMDDKNEIFSNGEIIMNGNLFGAGFRNEFFGRASEARVIAENLARADFVRTKKLVDKFERLEFRMMARIIVLRSVLNPQDEMKGQTIVGSDDF